MDTLPFRTVGFDLDGTLIDSSGDLGEALNHVLKSTGRAPVPLGSVSSLIGGGARVMLVRALALTGGPLPEAEVSALHHDLIAYYAANIAVHTRPYPGAVIALEALARRGVTLAVVTNKLEALALKVLDALDLTRHFALVLGGDSLGRERAKPAPDLLLEMQRRLDGGPCAFVGDSTFDTAAATAAGMPSIAVSFGFNDRPAHELGASAVIDRFDQLVPALEQLSAGATLQPRRSVALAPPCLVRERD